MPNSPDALAPLLAAGCIPIRRIWGMLALRSALSFGLLMGLAAVFALAGRASAVQAASAWWLWFVTITNVVCIVLMACFARAEGMHLCSVFHANRSTWKGDLGWTLAALGVTAVVAQPPGNFLAGMLWGDANYGNSVLLQALPIVAVYPLFFLMPTTHAFAELPLYWGYVAPRL